MYGHHSPRFVQLKNLATMSELSAELNTPKRTLQHWAKDRTFPRPIRKLAGVNIYDLAEVTAWKLDRERGGLRGVCLREYRRTGNVRAAARAAGIYPERARRWLKKMGEPLPRDPWPEDVPAPGERMGA